MTLLMSFMGSLVTKQKYRLITKIFYGLSLLQHTYSKLNLILINPSKYEQALREGFL